MKISILLATYNGEKYVIDQINSILPQLREGDELIILDDGSKDNTIALIEELRSPFIKLHINKSNLGHVKTFEKLLFLAKNEIIFMCDQDDIWKSNKVTTYINFFKNSDTLLISDNSDYIDGTGKVIDFIMPELSIQDSHNYKKNILDIYKGTVGYYGCAMALRGELNNIILPFPDYIESHDLWIAMAANLLHKNIHIDRRTFYRRIHGENDSLRKRPLSKKLYSRYVFYKSQKEINKRIKNNSYV